MKNNKNLSESMDMNQRGYMINLDEFRHLKIAV